ncbi:hypothetical protein JMJ35_006861 [Cladonia borealis]|uniref:Uncharacterized protein n=1 Tax=Cladonia borealis TaxID=184061 RepID=A0AA39QY32_9LECA|nr:hypothetical protein JMJ35_006861 [Cladonia borealis]
MATTPQHPSVALSNVTPAALGASRGHGLARNQQHGPTALVRPTQPSRTQQAARAATVSGAQQPNLYASFYSKLANTVMNVALIAIGLVLAGVYGKIAEKQGNESLKATLWRDCIDLPDTIGTTETCKKLLATGFDSLSKRSLQIQQRGVPSRLSLFWEELSALEQFYVLPSLLWQSAFGLDVFGRITVNTVSLVILFGLHAIFNAVSDTDQSVWITRRRFLLINEVWRLSLDFWSFIVGQVVGYLIWEWRDAAWLRHSPWIFVTQALHFDIAVYLISMILPGNILQKLTADHTTGALDKHTAGFIAILASVASLSWMYYHAFHFISPEDVNYWQNASREALSTWLVVTITTVVITLTMLKIPIIRQGLKYIVFEYMAFILSLLEEIPFLGAILCDHAGKFRRWARRHLFEFQHAD